MKLLKLFLGIVLIMSMSCNRAKIKYEMLIGPPGPTGPSGYDGERGEPGSRLEAYSLLGIKDCYKLENNNVYVKKRGHHVGLYNNDLCTKNTLETMWEYCKLVVGHVCWIDNAQFSLGHYAGDLVLYSLIFEYERTPHIKVPAYRNEGQ